jgi:streptomycin 6-kinase
LTGVDAQAIWDWGFVERVSTGLLGMQLGMDGSRDFLTVAERTAAVTQL